MSRSRKGHARADAKGRSKGDRPHIRLHHTLLTCPAWRSLPPVSRALLIEVWGRHTGFNNGEIPYSTREAAKALGIGKNEPTKHFRILIERGFLKERVKGSFHRKGGPATEWEVTAQPCDERPPTKDFMRWRPSPEIQNVVPLRGTNGPAGRDYGAATVPPEGTNGPAERDRTRQKR